MLEALPAAGRRCRRWAWSSLTGAGRGFCAGGDVKAMAEGREFGGTTLEEKAQALRSRMEVSRWLHEMPKPTIAMVRGAAAGAGLSLALACDLRDRRATPRASPPPSRASATPATSAAAGSSRSSSAPPRRASSTTRPTSSTPRRPWPWASSTGWCPTPGWRRRRMALAARLAGGPRMALRYMKRNINAAETGTLKDCLDLEAWHHTRCGLHRGPPRSRPSLRRQARARLQGPLMAFTNELWQSIEPIYAAILRHPFLRGLTDGSLPRESFDSTPSRTPSICASSPGRCRWPAARAPRTTGSSCSTSTPPAR